MNESGTKQLPEPRSIIMFQCIFYLDVVLILYCTFLVLVVVIKCDMCAWRRHVPEKQAYLIRILNIDNRFFHICSTARTRISDLHNPPFDSYYLLSLVVHCCWRIPLVFQFLLPPVRTVVLLFRKKLPLWNS